MDRKKFLLDHVKSHQCTRFLEIGVFNGHFAERLLSVARKSSPSTQIYYLGVDLFKEGLTSEKYLSEISLYPNTLSEVYSKLNKFNNVKIELIQGNSIEVIPLLPKNLKFDLVHIDGGHSLDTVKSDWSNISRLIGTKTAVFFDDYSNKRGVVKGGFGVKEVVDKIDTATFKIEHSLNHDFFWKAYGLLILRMVRVTLNTFGK